MIVGQSFLYALIHLPNYLSAPPGISLLIFPTRCWTSFSLMYWGNALRPLRQLKTVSIPLRIYTSTSGATTFTFVFSGRPHRAVSHIPRLNAPKTGGLYNEITKVEMRNAFTLASAHCICALYQFVWCDMRFSVWPISTTTRQSDIHRHTNKYRETRSGLTGLYSKVPTRHQRRLCGGTHTASTGDWSYRKFSGRFLECSGHVVSISRFFF